MFNKQVVYVVSLLLAGLSLGAQNDTSSNLEWSFRAESGFVYTIFHDIQIGRDAQRFDYAQNGGQELLLPYYRWEGGLTLGGKHELAFLYQPLTLRSTTRVAASGGLQMDNVLFAEDSPLDLKYGFDFYRGSYRYRLWNSSSGYFSVGGALQIRNASITFDGFGWVPEMGDDPDSDESREVRVITQDLGPVPVISMAARRNWGDGHFFEWSFDGFYAPIRYLNLRDVDVVGWLYDTAFRVGTEFRDKSELYLSLRVLGGGADGTAGERTLWTQSRSEPRYTWNNLNLAALTLGARLY